MTELMVSLEKEEDVYNIFSKLFNLSHKLSGRATEVVLLGFKPSEIIISLISYLRINGFSDIHFITNLGCGCQGGEKNCICSKVKNEIGIPDKSIIFNQKQMSTLNSDGFQGIVIKNNQHPQFIPNL